LTDGLGRMEKKVILSKFLSREHSLLYYHVWQQSNQNRLINPLFHIENILFIKKPGSGKTSNWYNLKELEDSDKETSEKIKQDLNFFPKVKEKYTEYWDKLSPYVKKEKNFKSLEELHEFYINWIKWWIMMVYSFRIPRIESIPKKIRGEALKIRKEHEQYSDETDRSLLKGFKELFPQYKEIAHVMTPEEVFSLKEKPLTEKEITNIKKRLNGFVFLNGKLYYLEDLDSVLSKNNLVLEGMGKTTLKKYYSRERSLFYSCMWYDSDCMAFSNWLKINLQTSFFLKDKNTNKTSVWYNPEELDNIKRAIERKITKETFEKMKKVLQSQWDLILPYLKNEKKVQDIEELKQFYNGLVKWWSVMDILFYIPDLKDIPYKIKKESLQLRLDSEIDSDKADSVLASFWKSNYPKYKNIISILTPSEVFKFGKGELKTEHIKEIRKRLKGYFALDGKMFLLNELDNVLSKNNLELKKAKDKDVKKIKGDVACRGSGILIKGKVKIILAKEQIKEFQEGDILVTEMTSPDYLPAMKKAVAIITDEGGVISHAAIVSRELNKPCIIGTKIATEVLKNGDVVEVDANKGIVKILKKK